MTEPALEEEPVPKDTWTEDDLKQAVKRINAGEININEAQSTYGIPPRVIHRQRAIENMRAQLNPDRATKKQNKTSKRKGDLTIKRQPMGISCTSAADLVELLQTSTDEIKHILSYECNIIYECKVCTSLFRSLSNFISHKRAYCRGLHKPRDNESEDEDEESSIESYEVICKKPETKPVRTTCKKDLTSVIDKLFMLHKKDKKPVVHLETIDKSSEAFYQGLASLNAPLESLTKQQMLDLESNEGNAVVELARTKETPTDKSHSQSPKSCDRCGKCHANNKNCSKIYRGQKRFGCPCCDMYLSLKKSVVRHLKTVHHKSVEQIIRLKSRIRIDHNISSESSSSQSNETSIKNRTIVKPKNGKYNCQFCHKFFIRKKELAYHLRKCDKRTSTEKESTNTNINNINLSTPVVTLIPISVPGSISSNVQSNKIGIQLRMNYGKSTDPYIPLPAQNRYCTRANANSNDSNKETINENGIHTHDDLIENKKSNDVSEEESTPKAIDDRLIRVSENVDQQTQETNNQLRVDDFVKIKNKEIINKQEKGDENDIPWDKWCILIKDDEEFNGYQVEEPESTKTYEKKGRTLQDDEGPDSKKFKMDQSNELQVVPIALRNGTLTSIELETTNNESSEKCTISGMKTVQTTIG